MKHPYLISRLSTLGIALVILVLTGLAISTTVLTNNLSNQTRTAIQISDVYQQASSLIASEETIDWHYHVEPGPRLRLQERAVNASLIGVFDLLLRVGGADDRSVAQQLRILQQRYFLAINEMFAAIDRGDRTQTHTIDSTEVDPLYAPMARLVNTVAGGDYAQEQQSLDELGQIQHGVLIGTPLAFGLSLALLGVFWAALRFYQRKLEQAVRDEIAQLTRAALTDQLTGLGNHRAYRQDMQREVERASDQGKTLGLALMDLDELNTINEDFGYLEGDRILSILGATLRESELSPHSYRLEGDGFALILPDTTRTDAARALDRLRQDAARQLVGATVSIGLEVAESGGGNTETLYQQADAALAEAKRRGRNTVVAFEEIRGRISIISPARSHALRRLLAEGTVSVVFQPIWDLERGRLLSFEALSRPAAIYGFDGPQEAFDLAEKLGQAHKLDAICIRAVLARAPELPADSLLFLNLTPQTLVHDLITCATLLEATVSAGLSPSRVVLEITERSIVEVDEIVQKVKFLRMMGFQMALDDVGAGNAGLEMLSQLPVDFVKIDRAVVNRALTDRAAYGVLVGIIAIARESHIAVIAEGIETPEMLALVQQLQVQYGQGYLLGRPAETIPVADTLQDLLSSWYTGPRATSVSVNETLLNPLHDIYI
jgi:diguanylate cyclase (GGDEF)-like protein